MHDATHKGRYVAVSGVHCRVCDCWLHGLKFIRNNKLASAPAGAFVMHNNTNQKDGVQPMSTYTLVALKTGSNLLDITATAAELALVEAEFELEELGVEPIEWLGQRGKQEWIIETKRGEFALKMLSPAVHKVAANTETIVCRNSKFKDHDDPERGGALICDECDKPFHYDERLNDYRHCDGSSCFLINDGIEVR